MSATSADVDPTLKKAIMLLHSDDPNSATEIRLMLDELIKQRYGPSKMLIHLTTQKHLDLEKNFPGVATSPPEQTGDEASTDEVINLTNSPVKTISDSPDTIPDSDDAAMLTMATSEEVENLKEFGDLNCCVCGEMMFTATNRLIECSQCGSLYHQECHKPTITNEETSDDQDHNWQCNTCNDKPSTSRAAAAAATSSTAGASTSATAAMEDPIALLAKAKSSASSSRSSSSSNSSSPFYRQEHSSSSSSKQHKSSSSSSKSHKEKDSSSRAGAVITPAINIISAPDRGSSSTSSSKTKSSSSHSSSSKSSRSSSKHHESSSKRKLSK